MQQSAADLPETAVRVRHILYSPKDDPSGAQDGTIPADDPSWAAAEADARAAYAKLQADPTQFDAIARAESDETSARGITGTGGKLPGYVTNDGSYVKEFEDAVLKPRPRPTARSSRRSSRRSAGTSSRSSTIRPTRSTSRPSRRRPTEARTSGRSRATTPTARKPARAATSA